MTMIRSRAVGRALLGAVLVFGAVLPFGAVLAFGTSARAAAPEPTAAISIAARGVSSEQIDRLVAALDSEEPGTRSAAATTLGELGEDAVPAVAKKLAELRKTPAASVMAAVKRAKVADGSDLCEALMKVQRADTGTKTALATAALLRGLAHVGTTQAARELVGVAGDGNGAFRPEIARRTRALGDKAIPALILVRKDASSDLRQWATTQLEAMGKRIPSDAVQTRDPHVLAEVLTAYGAVRDLDALAVLLSFVNSDRSNVRTAARGSVMAFGQDAVWKLREAHANVIGKSPPEGAPAAEIATSLFAAYDRLRLQEVYGLLDDGLKKHAEGKTDEAIAAFDRVLARQPMLDRRAEMAAAYLAHAQKIEDEDPVAALEFLRKAARLGSQGPRGPLIDAEIAYLEGRDLRARGIPDAVLFERALALDPMHAKARAELERMAASNDEGRSRTMAASAAVAALLLALTGMLLFGRTRRASRTAA